jgi:predicted metal-dependent enzyme (double-stranded beta helix superfamily)
VQTQTPAAAVTIPAPDLASMDAPVRRLFERIAPALTGATPDVDSVAAAMIEFARDHDYLVPRIRAMGERGGGTGLHAPARGPRLMLVHRAEGQMGAIHDHGCWVALTPVTGVETHRHFRVHARGTEFARLELATELTLHAGQSVTMLTPEDTHSHGHLAGSGEPAYVLIMVGDDQRLHRRSEWDTVTGRRRVLEVGDGGRWIDSVPFPDA